jgi:hypothetical protein
MNDPLYRTRNNFIHGTESEIFPGVEVGGKIGQFRCIFLLDVVSSANFSSPSRRVTSFRLYCHLEPSDVQPLLRLLLYTLNIVYVHET